MQGLAKRELQPKDWPKRNYLTHKAVRIGNKNYKSRNWPKGRSSTKIWREADTQSYDIQRVGVAELEFVRRIFRVGMMLKLEHRQMIQSLKLV